MKKNTTHNLTVAAMLSAVAFILMFIEFPLPMLIPSFVKMDFSDLPALLGAFALGPVYGVVISFMKNLLHIIIKGTSTACVGELCNFMLGAVFSAVAGFVYKRHKSRKTAILGAIAGAAVMAVFSVPSNYFITYPAYVQFYHMPLEAILGMYQAILPSADSLIKCLVIFNMPFTLVKGLLADDPHYLDNDIKRYPLGYFGEPDDVAYGVLFLASDEGRFVTGTKLVIDGGYTAQ